MGACADYRIAFGKTPAEAFASACHECLHQYGHDPYNGTLSTTSLAGPLEIPPVKRWTRKHLGKLSEAGWDLPKWEARYVEITGKLARDLKKSAGLTRTHKRVYLFVGLAAC